MRAIFLHERPQKARKLDQALVTCNYCTHSVQVKACLEKTLLMTLRALPLGRRTKARSKSSRS